jgi:hypothetical protein
MKVGLSLSFCVQDIMNGKVDINDVAFIYSGTYFRNTREWDIGLNQYKEVYWVKNPSEGERIARYFLEKGLIIQPRLEGKYLFKGQLNWLEESEFNAYCAANMHNE